MVGLAGTRCLGPLCNFQVLLPHSVLPAHATKLNPMHTAASSTHQHPVYTVFWHLLPSKLSTRSSHLPTVEDLAA